MEEKKQISLKEAVKRVINQNRYVKYNPQIFFHFTKNGEAKDLAIRIGDVVKSPDAFNSVLEEIRNRKGKYISTIEEFIVRNDFGLPSDIVEKAKENLRAYNWERAKIMNKKPKTIKEYEKELKGFSPELLKKIEKVFKVVSEKSQISYDAYDIPVPIEKSKLLDADLSLSEKDLEDILTHFFNTFMILPLPPEELDFGSDFINLDLIPLTGLEDKPYEFPYKENFSNFGEALENIIYEKTETSGIPDIYYEEKSGVGFINKRKFKFKDHQPEYRVFAELHKNINKKVDRYTVLVQIGFYEENEKTDPAYKINETYKINNVCKKIRKTTKLNTGQLVNNNGNLTLIGKKMKEPPK